ncbi:hypothetical protein KSD_43600 [Ktedonobacter sp. SOSP1-85]|uniref:NAD(P)/FAD-dependent oxidoreductase n=1 Tax=Ktedonobacter sp. SOSP1-85 TaxID=2778367 RepID=UPI0019153E8B|nr:FAD-dependent oxidoreductase [Ktedonobacter sp. SOSP1-85]GHO76589.1 hypothetical protein KSD_43600 [Ktedonobacter sp. SOSP1-85]
MTIQQKNFFCALLAKASSLSDVKISTEDIEECKAGNHVQLYMAEIGAQASSAAAGLLAPLGPIPGPGQFADLLMSGFRLLIDLIPESEETSNIHIGYEQTGALRTVRNLKRVSHLQQRMEAWQPLGLKMYLLTGDEARKQEPLLDSHIQAAIYAPEKSQVKAPQVVQAYYQAAQRLGAIFLSP